MITPSHPAPYGDLPETMESGDENETLDGWELLEDEMKYAMFAVVGAILASGGIGVTDWQLYATLIAMGVASFGS